MIETTCIGHLGKDATINNVNGKSVINFTVAHTEKWTDNQGQMQQKTIWLDCGYWTDKTAVAQYMKTGTQVWVRGTPDVRTYQAADGTTKGVLSLKVFQVQLLGSPNHQSQQPQPQQQQQQQQQAPGFNPYNQPQPQPQAAPRFNIPNANGFNVTNPSATQQAPQQNVYSPAQQGFGAPAFPASSDELPF